MILRFVGLASLSGLAALVLIGCADAPSANTSRRMQRQKDERLKQSSTASSPAAATYESLVICVNQSAQNEAYDEGLRFADRALELKPDSYRVLFMATQMAQQQGIDLYEVDREKANDRFTLSAKYARHLQRTHPLEEGSEHQKYFGGVFYNAARAHAQRGEIELGLVALTDAVTLGYEDFDLISSDASLDNLRASVEFDEIVAAPHQAKSKQRMRQVEKRMAEQKSYRFDFDLVSTSGKRVQRSDFQGKLLIVDFWGTWCQPCRQEIPHFIKLLGQYQEEGLEMVGINYENGNAEDHVALINRFATDFGVPYPCLLGDEKTKARVYQFEGFPTTLFLDGTGRVRLQLTGYHPYDLLDAVIKTLLAEVDGAEADVTAAESPNRD